jgi:hypothetical protein
MVHIIRTAWAGTTGGAGLTQLAVDTDPSTFGPLGSGDAQDSVNAVRAFWDGVKAYLPNEIVLTVSPVVDYYLTDSGELAGSVTAATAPTSVGGTATSAYSMASGVKANLNTSVIQNGRRVRGAIYLVPAADVYNVTGTVVSTARTAINAAGATLINSLSSTGMKLMVWSRPLSEEHPLGPRDGTTSIVQSMEVNEKGAILRGRRD